MNQSNQSLYSVPARLRRMENMHVVFWITANAYWMISEFAGFDGIVVWKEFTGKHLAIIPFVTGALILLYYYAVQRPKEMKVNKIVTM